ncbi:hypothetical protein BMS3Abin07_00858 [bacterium BMS3Abin07]|nr:hypothetical protein BMS3Abin07_00858 [bacterium BMS3Abin07]GBE33049.1 hypothetical protein BMS3Bbin05_01981 [bacterium BMS3Bbin05]
MRIGDILYFSPKYTFSALQWDNKDCLIAAFRDRVEGFYLNPAEELNHRKYTFASGVMCVTTIDFLARIETCMNNARNRNEKWLKDNIEEFKGRDPSKHSQSLASRFYDEFRNGLVHEGRIKNAGQFSYNFGELVKVEESAMIVNPGFLLKAIKGSFERFIDKVKSDDSAFRSLKCALLRDFRKEVEL